MNAAINYLSPQHTKKRDRYTQSLLVYNVGVTNLASVIMMEHGQFNPESGAGKMLTNLRMSRGRIYH